MPEDLSTTSEKIKMLRWHLDRYDRLRGSTANRAGVVLSAAALISAANALLLSEVSSMPARGVPLYALAACMAIVLAGATLVVIAAIRACGVLVTLKDSRTLFDPRDQLPPSPLFNGTDTVRRLQTFDQFREIVAVQSDADLEQAAEVELWIGIKQHRHRYLRLRSAVRILRYAAVVFLAALMMVIVLELSYRAGLSWPNLHW